MSFRSRKRLRVEQWNNFRATRCVFPIVSRFMFTLLIASAAQASTTGSQFPGLEKVVTNQDTLPVVGCAMLTLIMLACVVRWLARGAMLRRARAADARFLAAFRGSAHVLAVFQSGESVSESPHSTLYANACRELAFHLLGTDVVDKAFAMRLRAAGRVMPSQWQATQRAAQRSIEESTRWFRSGLTGSGLKSLLPLGLFFSLLALLNHAGAGTLNTEAAASSARPFALALLYYAIGMVWLDRVLRRAEGALAELHDFSTELGMLLERSFVDHRHPMEALPSLGAMGMTSDGPSFNLPPSEPAKAGAR
jgi:hypothetical protein